MYAFVRRILMHVLIRHCRGRFVEFSEHAHALIALRRLNNCGVTGKKHNFGKRFMVDFALDDARIVRQRRIKQVRVDRAKHRRAEATKEEQAAEEAVSGKRMGRGALQREKKRTRGDEEEAPAGGKGGKGGKDSKGAGKVKWGAAEDEDGKHKKDLSKPYREKGNSVDGVVRAGTGRRAPAAADSRGVKAAAKAASATAAKKAKAVARSGDAHLASLVEEVGDLIPKAKKAKRNNKDKEDGFDQLVKQYNSTLFKSDGGGEGRWFD